MCRNYKIAKHPYYHAGRCAKRALTDVAGKAWSYFLYPVLLVACGVAAGTQMARMFGSALEVIWR